MEKTISNSGKNRQGHYYTRDNHGQPKTVLDGNARSWKQVIVVTDSGRKRTNGKPLMISKTKHIPS